MAESKQPGGGKGRGDEAPGQPPAGAGGGEGKAEEDEPERLNHWEAAHRVVKQIDGDTTLSELAYDANKLVVAGGGKSNEDRAWNAVLGVLQSLQELGIVEMTEEVSVHPLHRLP